MFDDYIKALGTIPVRSDTTPTKTKEEYKKSIEDAKPTFTEINSVSDFNDYVGFYGRLCWIDCQLKQFISNRTGKGKTLKTNNNNENAEDLVAISKEYIKQNKAKIKKMLSDCYIASTPKQLTNKYPSLNIDDTTLTDGQTHLLYYKMHTYIETQTSDVDDFTYFIKGKGDCPSHPLKWKYSVKELSIFLEALMDYVKWKPVSKIFVGQDGGELSARALSTSLSNAKSPKNPNPNEYTKIRKKYKDIIQSIKK